MLVVRAGPWPITKPCARRACACYRLHDANVLGYCVKPGASLAGQVIAMTGCHRFRTVFFFFVVAFSGVSAFDWIAIAQEKPERNEKITITIDYADGVEKHFKAIEWQKGMTVFRAMQAAQAHPRGIRFEHRGQGETALLTKIDELANEGAKRNWLYRVNGKLANESFGIQELSPGDVVLWKFQ